MTTGKTRRFSLIAFRRAFNTYVLQEGRAGTTAPCEALVQKACT